MTVSWRRLRRVAYFAAGLWVGHLIVVALAPECPTVYRWYHMNPELRWLLLSAVERCEGR